MNFHQQNIGENSLCKIISVKLLSVGIFQKTPEVVAVKCAGPKHEATREPLKNVDAI